MTVTFCGHGKINYNKKTEDELKFWVEKMIKSGADEFLLGGYGNFDSMAAKVVRELKEKYPYIRLTLVVPYIDRKYNKELYDESIYPELENVPKRFAIIKRNEYMVDMSDIVIAYIDCDFGGAVKTLKYARKIGKQIIRLNVGIRS